MCFLQQSFEQSIIQIWSPAEQDKKKIADPKISKIWNHGNILPRQECVTVLTPTGTTIWNQRAVGVKAEQ